MTEKDPFSGIMSSLNLVTNLVPLGIIALLAYFGYKIYKENCFMGIGGACAGGGQEQVKKPPTNGGGAGYGGCPTGYHERTPGSGICILDVTGGDIASCALLYPPSILANLPNYIACITKWSTKYVDSGATKNGGKGTAGVDVTKYPISSVSSGRYQIINASPAWYAIDTQTGRAFSKEEYARLLETGTTTYGTGGGLHVDPGIKTGKSSYQVPTTYKGKTYGTVKSVMTTQSGSRVAGH